MAEQAGRDVEEVLITAWDAGFPDIDDPDAALSPADVDRITRAVGLPSASSIRRAEYWRAALAVTEDELRSLLAESGLIWRPGAKVLPKGSIRVLKRHARGVRLIDTPPVEPTVVTPPAAFVAPLEWVRTGRDTVRKFLSADQIEAIHWAVARDFAEDKDPIVPAGVRDRVLLESAAWRQHTAIGEERKYPTSIMAAAALFHSLVLNHPFHNGNKRTALVSMIVFLDENGSTLTSDEEQLFKLVLRLAQHSLVAPTVSDLADREVMWITNWLDANARPTEKGERPLQWRRLKRILADFGCTWSFAPGVGNRLNITRELRDSGRWRRRNRVLSAQVAYSDDGSEALKNTVHELRRRLELDEEHGVDSASFYGSVTRSVDEFVAHYRKLLQRLARF